MKEPLTYEGILTKAERVDTTTGMNGCPERLRLAYTAETMAELRAMKEAAEAEGYHVTVLCLHRRDGWALWERSNDYGLDDDRWMGAAKDNEWIIDIGADSDREQIAFEHVCGDDGSDILDAKQLFKAAERVQDLAEALPDPDTLEEGEIERVWMRDGDILYTVRTGQNGYSYDTHHYKSALLITEKEA